MGTGGLADFLLRIMGSTEEFKQKDDAMGCAYRKNHWWIAIWVKGKRGYREMSSKAPG